MKKLDTNYIKSEFTKIQNYFLTGRYDKVIEKTLVLLKKDPGQFAFYNYIGLSYRQLNKLEDAEKIFNRALKLFPNSLSIICNLGSLYRIMQKYEQSEYLFQRGLQIKKDDFNILCNYGNLKRDLNLNEEAINYYKKAYDINNKNVALLINMAAVYQINGEFESSKKLLKKIQSDFPKNTKADFMYSSIHNYSEIDEHRDMMLEKLNLELDNQNLDFLYFALAKSYADISNYKESSKYFIKANKEHYKQFPEYNFNNELKIFSKVKDLFKDFKFKNVDINTKPELIFIVGMPRSGTTLTHQIISSHSNVYGGGEMLIIGKIFNKKIHDNVYLDNFFKTKSNEFNEFINKTSKEIKKIFIQFSKEIILDKSPLNFIWIGFIKALFPTAKIIHCKRNLRDVALSIYKNSFEAGSLPWSYNDENIVDFINAYEDLMLFWNNLLQNEIYHCEYENLVMNKEDETRKLINFCNLEWEDQCIDHTKNKSSIKTVSIYQARKPIYTSSIKLSDNYLDYLDFLKKL